MKQRNRPYPHFKFPDEITIGVTQLTDSECNWYNVPKGSYALRCLNYGWFPTNALMGVIKGKYSDTNKIGATISGNLGSASLAVLDVDASIKLLVNEGYNLEINKK